MTESLLATPEGRVWSESPPAPEASTVAEVLEQAISRWPKRTAFICDDTVISYSDVGRLTAAASVRLAGLGVEAGDRVGLWMANSAEFLGWYFALAQIGAVAVTLHTRSTAEEVEAIVDIAAPTVLIAGNGVGAPRPETVEAIVRSARLTDAEVAVADAHLVAADAALSSPSVADPRELFLIKFTSGSSSAPKGVQLEHAQIVRNGYNAGARLGLCADDVLFSPMPFFHSGGSILTILTAFTHGATIVSQPRFDAEAAVDAIQEHSCTAHIGMDVMYLKEMDAANFNARSMRSLRTGWIAGLADAAKRVSSAMQFPFVNLYGMTELSGNICMTATSDPAETRVVYAGIPQPGLEVGVFVPESKRLVPRGERGEIRIRGWGLMRGYLGESSPVDDDGWLRTGDGGVVARNGYLRFLGRIRETLKVGGENVSCAEVEAALSAHSAVAIAQVVGVPDPTYGELPVAFIQLTARGGASPEELIDWCRAKIAGYKVPRHIFLLASEEWPLTGPEKISRPGLKRLAKELVDGPPTVA